jgi:hypothetical protein
LTRAREQRRFRIPTAALAHGGTTFGLLNGSYPPVLARRLLEMLRRLDLMVTPARHLAEKLDGLGLPRVEVVPNPVDCGAFARDPSTAKPHCSSAWATSTTSLTSSLRRRRILTCTR